MAERREVILDIQVRGRDAQKRLGEVTTALKKNSESLKELNRQYKSGEIEAEAYGDATAAVKLESAELRKEQSSLTRQITNTTKATKAAEGSNEQLRAQLSLLTKEYNSLSKEQRENSERGKELQIQTRAISDELKENEKAVGDNRRNVGNYQSALDGLGGALDKVIPGFSNFTKGLGSTAGKGKEAGSVLSSLAGQGGKLGKVAGTLGKRLGGPLVTALIAVAAAGVKAAQAIAEITREFDPLNRQVNQLTGAQGESLNDITAQVKGLADTFGQDFNEVLRAANTTANAFGISIDEALEQIGEGFINGADASGEYLSVLQEYPAQLASVGLSLEEANALILTQTQEGIFSDKGIDAIKEAGIRLRELTPATREALDGIGIVSEEVEKGLREGSVELFDVIQQVGGRLGELEANSPEVGAAIADIFGGPGEDAGLDYLRLLGEIDGDLADVTRASEEFTEQQRRDLEVTEDLARAKSDLSESFAPVVNLFDRFGKQILTFLIEQVNDIVYRLTVFWPSAFDGAAAGVKALGNNIKVFAEETVLNLQIAAKEVENFFSFSDEVENELAELRGKKDALANEYKSFGEAAADAFNEGIESRTLDVEAIGPRERSQRTATTTGGSGGSTSGGTSTSRGRSAEDEAKDAARAEEQRQREILRVQKAAIEQRINEEKLGLIRLEQDTLIADERKNQLRLEAEERLINLRAQLALNGLEEESAQARLIVAQSEAEIAQIQIDESNRVLGIKLDNEQLEREALAETGEAAIKQQQALADEAERRRLLLEQAKKDAEAFNDFVAGSIAGIESALANGDLISLVDITDNLIDVFQDAGATAGEKFAAGIGGAAAAVAGVLSLVESQIEVVDRESAERARKVQISQLIFSGISSAAQALFQAIAQLGPIAGPAVGAAQAALIGTLTAINVKRLRSEPLQFADGGIVEGPRHSQGGVPFSVAGSGGYEMEGGEFVVNRRSTAAFRPALEAMNNLGRSTAAAIPGRRFADGGFVGVQAVARQTESVLNQGEDLISAVMRLPNPVVSVSDINKTQNRVEVKQRTGL